MQRYAIKNDQEDMKLAVRNLLSEMNYLESKPTTEHVITRDNLLLQYCSVCLLTIIHNL